MPLKSLVGLDHVVVTVTDLEHAAEAWRALGFTLSPPGRHSAHIGTGNYTIMLDPDYLELLGVLAETEQNAPTRAYLAANGDGVERVAFTLRDADAGAAELRARGLEATGPVDFGRPVELPGGGRGEARFRTIFWPQGLAPAGVRLFACQHLTRETVWIPELMRHANTARRIVRLDFVSPRPREAAEEAASLIGAEAVADEAGFTVESGGGRAAFRFRDRAGFAALRPGLALDGLPEEGIGALVLAADDLDAAARAVGPRAQRREGAVTVPATNGVAVDFVPA